MSVHYRACNLCEASCGLEITVEANRVIGIRGDVQDPFSGGYLCPKGVALQDLTHDPDRLRRPVRRLLLSTTFIQRLRFLGPLRMGLVRVRSSKRWRPWR